MKKNLRLLCLTVALVTSTMACSAKNSTDASSTSGGGSGSTPTPTPTPTSKAVTSVWSAATGATVVLDLSAGNLNGTTFAATLSYMGSVCTYQLQLLASTTPNNCNVTATPTFNSNTTGFSSANCTDNDYNICGIGAASGIGSYSWDGNGLSFPNNGTQYR